MLRPRISRHRRRLVVGLGVVVAIAQAGATAGSVPTAAATPSYTWSKSAIDGGGFANAIALDPSNPRHLVVAGDVYGESDTFDGGNTWTPRMTGTIGYTDTYGRAVAFSLAHPGLAYACTGPQQYVGGQFGVISGWNFTARSTTVNCGSSGGAVQQPRPDGHLIAVDMVRGVEYIYVASSAGVVRSTDGGIHWTTLGLAAAAPAHAFAGLTLAGHDTLYVATFRTSTSGGSHVYRIDGIRGRASATELRGAPPVVEELATINGTVFAAAGAWGTYRVTGNGSTWTKLDAKVLGGEYYSAVAGVGTTIYLGTSFASAGSHHSIALSRDGGASFEWVTLPGSTSDVIAGTATSWWLSHVTAGFMLGGNGYSASQIVVDPADARVVYVAGRSGVWRSYDGGAHWVPAVHGLGGTVVQHVVARSGGDACNDDADFEAGEHTTDYYAHVIPGLNCTVGRASLTRTVGGHTYTVVMSNPRDIRRDGRSVATAFFHSAAATVPTDLAIAANGTIYVSLNGGGVLVGRPG